MFTTCLLSWSAGLWAQIKPVLYEADLRGVKIISSLALAA